MNQTVYHVLQAITVMAMETLYQMVYVKLDISVLKVSTILTSISKINVISLCNEEYAHKFMIHKFMVRKSMICKSMVRKSMAHRSMYVNLSCTNLWHVGLCM